MVIMMFTLVWAKITNFKFIKKQSVYIAGFYISSYEFGEHFWTKIF